MQRIPLTICIAFLTIFHATHPTHRATPELQFRLRLLKFVALYANRFSRSHANPSLATLQDLRNRHKAVAEASPLYNKLPHDLKATPLSDSLSLSRSEEKGGQSISRDNMKKLKPELRRSLAVPSLLDTLPEFMAMSAAQIVLQGGEVTDTWKTLATGYMVQAVLEQVLFYKAEVLNVIKQAFAWGFDSESTAEEDSDEFQINAMFFNNQEQEGTRGDGLQEGQIEGWDLIRDDHIRAVRTMIIIGFHPW